MNAGGRAGEDFAAKWLEGQGYTLIQRNYRSRYGEIDLIAKNQDVICFVEVKSRRKGSMVSGAEAVSPSKQRKIIRTALLFLQEHPCDLQPRFDVCSVVAARDGTVLSHDYITGAFDGEAYTETAGH